MIVGPEDRFFMIVGPILHGSGEPPWNPRKALGVSLTPETNLALPAKACPLLTGRAAAGSPARGTNLTNPVNAMLSVLHLVVSGVDGGTDSRSICTKDLRKDVSAFTILCMCARVTCGTVSCAL